MAGAETRERILRATVDTLADQGYARTTARAIAVTGGFTAGVIYYHFADLDDLFIATAEFTSGSRLQRYREETEAVTSAHELITRLRRLYVEDAGTRHVAAVQELVAAATGSPKLAAQLRIETARWQDLAETIIGRFAARSPFANLVPVRELAATAVATYLGVEMLSHLNADRQAPEALFEAAERAAILYDSITPGNPPR
ncbi:MAG: TetR/AcrR family transcriptional regulator [Kribbellaceae bacterium]